MPSRDTSGRLRRSLHPLYRWLETQVHPLRYLFLEITQRCNLSCRHCGSDCGRDAQLEELTTDEWLGLFAYLAEHFDPRRLLLIITGGEPFCAPSFDRILAGLGEHRLAWGMVTNGLALTRANVDRVVAHGIASLTVSLDGVGESHDWLRGKDGAFEKTVAGLERVVAARLPFFDVVTCVHPGNLAELPRVLELLQALGVPQWRLFSIFPKGRARENRELLLSPEQLRELLDFIREQRARLEPHDIRVQFSCEGYLPARLDREVRDEPYFCRAGISIGSVLCDGSICACPNISRSLVQGNIRHDDLREVWEQRFRQFRDRRWLRQGECQGCREWKRCRGNSMHLYDEELGCTGFCSYRAVSEASRS